MEHYGLHVVKNRSVSVCVRGKTTGKTHEDVLAGFFSPLVTAWIMLIFLLAHLRSLIFFNGLGLKIRQERKEKRERGKRRRRERGRERRKEKGRRREKAREEVPSRLDRDEM